MTQVYSQNVININFLYLFIFYFIHPKHLINIYLFNTFYQYFCFSLIQSTYYNIMYPLLILIKS
jgi:hypothetical protein